MRNERDVYSYLNVGQSGQSVMAESADVLTGVCVVERMAAVGCSQAKLAAVVNAANILENGIDSLQNATF